MNEPKSDTNPEQLANLPQLDLVAILAEDYARFPQDQTYDIYGEDVYFKDPLNEFRGS